MKNSISSVVEKILKGKKKNLVFLLHPNKVAIVKVDILAGEGGGTQGSKGIRQWPIN